MTVPRIDSGCRCRRGIVRMWHGSWCCCMGKVRMLCVCVYWRWNMRVSLMMVKVLRLSVRSGMCIVRLNRGLLHIECIIGGNSGPLLWRMSDRV